MNSYYEELFTALSGLELVGTLRSETKSNIFLAEHPETKEYSVVKFVSHNDSKRQAEGQVLQTLSHPNIIQVKDTFCFSSSSGAPSNGFEVLMGVSNPTKNPEISAIVMEYAPKGDLLDFIHAFGRLPEQIARKYFQKLIDTLEYLHKTALVCHRDIKPENILIDEQFDIKLADFGSSIKISREGECLVSGRAGTPRYFSPERFTKERYDAQQADLFALGITLFIMVAGCLPFKSATKEDDLYRMLIEERTEEFWQFHEKLQKNQCESSTDVFDPSFRDLISSMLAYNPINRLSLETIKNHPWCTIQSLKDEDLESYCLETIEQLLV